MPKRRCSYLPASFLGLSVLLLPVGLAGGTPLNEGGTASGEEMKDFAAPDERATKPKAFDWFYARKNEKISPCTNDDPPPYCKQQK
jgi:hypothetical protein